MRLIIFGIILFVCTSALLVAAHFGVRGFSLDPQIKPVEVFTLSVNIFIAFFLQYYLASRVTDARAEKDLVIANTREAIQQLRLCRDVVSSAHDASKITADRKRRIVVQFRRLANELDNLESVLQTSAYHPLSGHYDALMQGYLAYKMAATGGDFPSKPYSRHQISDQERFFRSLNSKLQGLIFEINRHR